MSSTAAISSVDLDSPRLRRPPAPRQLATGLVGALNAEWRRLAAAPPEHTPLAIWRTRCRALASFTDLASVVDGATSGDNEVLGALLVLAREGDELAARTALQAVLGSVVRLARRTVAHAGGDLEESISRAVEACWRIIRNYPVQRACRPLDGISLDVLAVLTGSGRHGEAEVPVGLPVDLGDPIQVDEGTSELRAGFWAAVRLRSAWPCADEELIVLFAWAVRAGVISRAEAQLLLRLHSPDEPGRAVTSRELAEHLGIEHAAVRQRVSRATRRLAAAVQEFISAADPVAA